MTGNPPVRPYIGGTLRFIEWPEDCPKCGGNVTVGSSISGEHVVANHGDLWRCENDHLGHILGIVDDVVPTKEGYGIAFLEIGPCLQLESA